MKNMKNDWRYMKQDRYLHDMKFTFKQYDIPYPAHDHCEFCWIKFGAGGEIQKVNMGLGLLSGADLFLLDEAALLLLFH